MLCGRTIHKSLTAGVCKFSTQNVELKESMQIYSIVGASLVDLEETEKLPGRQWTQRRVIKISIKIAVLYHFIWVIGRSK